VPSLFVFGKIRYAIISDNHRHHIFSPSSFASRFNQFPLCPLRNHEMEKEQQFDTLQDFKNALEN
jgi:hypothetical protein